MKISKYIFLFSNENSFYIYNTLSNSLLGIDEESYNVLSEYQKEKAEIDTDRLDNELYNILIEKRFVVENDTDEYLLYRAIVENNRELKNSMHLTMVPTMDCNFRCHYCFEKKEKTYMTSDIMDSIIKYVISNKDLENIKLTWFGGEPLMAVDQIKEFHTKFRKVWNKEFDSNIITTGYHLTPEIIETLKTVEVSSIQITLDGNKDSHNKIKFTDECDDVFSKIIKNIDLITDQAPDIHIVIRVNITRENMDEFDSLHNYLSTRYKGKKLNVEPAIVEDRGSCDSCIPSENPFLTRKEFSNFILDLFHKKRIYTSRLQYPDRFFYECAIRNKTAIGFDPNGYAYKCWEIIGNKKYAIGKLEDGELKKVNHTMLHRQLYGADPISDPKCSKCSYLPICNGGCPIHRIENEFENGNIDVCTYHKGLLPEFMKIHLALKKAGYTNR